MFALISLPLRLIHRDVCAVLSSLDGEKSNNKYGSKEDMFHNVWQRVDSATFACVVLSRQ